ncbi:MAG: hypothetical protein D4R81_05190 [Nitrospiraceae bacterium]|nr:MAG: hypothetical protein D4R81_05190 [Nitrospiraceae bacterium]
MNIDIECAPQCLEAEQAVLGAILLDNAAFKKIDGLLSAGDFYKAEHQKIFVCVLDMLGRGVPVDLVTLADELERRGEMDRFGGVCRLTDLAQSVATTASIGHHAKIIRRHAQARKVVACCHKVIEAAPRSEDPGRLLVEAQGSICPTSTLTSVTLDESNPVFRPIDVGTLLEEPEEEISWVVDGYLAPGSLTLLAGPPKIGKTTLAYDAVDNVALGRPWLGRVVRSCKVLVLGVEEHRRDIVRRFWAVDEEALTGRIKIVFGALPFTEEVLREIVAYIQKEEIGLVLVDTLPFWWGLDDENSASEVIRAGGLLIKAIRQTQAAWLCNAHTRKSGGEHGQEVRGSSALLGLVDVSLSLKRTDAGGTQRVLEAVSRYANTPTKVVINLGEHGYEALGTPEDLALTAKIEKVRTALSDTPQTVKALMVATGLSKQDISRALPRLGEPFVKEGTGHKNAPFTYRRHSISPTPNPKGGACDESNTGHEMRSVAPPVPCDESNPVLDEVLVDVD